MTGEAFPVVMLNLSLCLAVVFVILLSQRRWAAPGALTVLALVVLAGHILVGMLFLQTEFGRDGDLVGYDAAGRNIASALDGQARLLQLDSRGKEGWSCVLGVAYWIAGPSKSIGVV